MLFLLVGVNPALGNSESSTSEDLVQDRYSYIDRNNISNELELSAVQVSATARYCKYLQKVRRARTQGCSGECNCYISIGKS
jgi:hypothetical protein